MNILKDTVFNPAPAPSSGQAAPVGLVNATDICNRYREHLQAMHAAQNQYNWYVNALNNLTIEQVCNQIALRSQQAANTDTFFEMLGGLGVALMLSVNESLVLSYLQAYLVTPATTTVANFWSAYGSVLAQYGFTANSGPYT